MGLFGFKKINSDEYKELKLQVELLWIEIDILKERHRRKVKPKGVDVPEETGGIDDGFNELRKLNKEKIP